MKKVRIVHPGSFARAMQQNPAGYQEEVESVALGRDDHGRLVLSEADFLRLHEKYQTPPSPPPADPQRGSGFQPGDMLKKLIAAVTGEPPCGACNEHVAEMNQRGWAWCLANHRTIAQWLCESALKRAAKLEAAAAEAQDKAAKARAAADAIDPEKSLSLVKAAWKEMKG